MSRIVACYKWVMDEAEFRINADSSVDTSKAKGKISDYDKHAIEAAVQAADSLGGKPVGLTFGDPKSKASLKDALSRGLEEGYWATAAEGETPDGAVTARVLAAAIKKINDISLVICAEGASDTYARQTAPRVGAILDLPVVTSVSKISFEGGLLIAERKLDDCIETVKVEMPAVISVLPEANRPDIPGLKAVLAAGKKPVTEFKSTDLGVDLTPRTRVTSAQGYIMNRKNVIFKDGDATDKVRDLVAALRKDGVC